MSSVVQTSYRPQMAKGVAGLIIDEGGYSIATKLCYGADIPFGMAVTQSAAGSKFAQLGGGGTFLGITARDVTLDGRQLSPAVDPVAPSPVDEFDLYRNMPILSRGRIYAQPDTNVAPGDPVYYDYDTGQLGSSASGRSGVDSIAFSGQPAVNDTITFNGTVVTFVASGPTATHCVIGPTLGDTLTALAALLNASTDGNINDATYGASPPSPGGAGQGSGANKLNIAHDTPGAGGNAYTLAKSCSAATLGGATMTGGGGGDDATGSVVFSANPIDGSTITLAGHAVAFKDTPAAGDVQIGGNLAATLVTLAARLNDEGAAPGNNVDIKKATYSANADGVTLNIAYDTVGTAGDAFSVATNVVGATVPKASLAGGEPASIQVADAWWATSSMAGDLAVVSLGVQM